MDERNNSYILAVISVKFDYKYKTEGGKAVKVRQLREYFYINGFNIDGVIV